MECKKCIVNDTDIYKIRLWIQPLAQNYQSCWRNLLYYTRLLHTPNVDVDSLLPCCSQVPFACECANIQLKLCQVHQYISVHHIFWTLFYPCLSFLRIDDWCMYWSTHGFPLVLHCFSSLCKSFFVYTVTSVTLLVVVWGQGNLESRMVDVGAGQGSYTKMKTPKYGWRRDGRFGDSLQGF